MEEILTQLRAALMAHTALPVYFSYDPSPFDQRKTQFLVLGVESMEMQPSFLTDTHLCRGFSMRFRVSLCMPAETDMAAVYTAFHSEVLEGMLIAGAEMQEIRSGTPAEIRQLRRMVLHGTFSLSGVLKTTREEVSAQ